MNQITNTKKNLKNLLALYQYKNRAFATAIASTETSFLGIFSDEFYRLFKEEINSSQQFQRILTNSLYEINVSLIAKIDKIQKTKIQSNLSEK
jgi:hypothetical protein